jgi:hypothetical protein
MSEKRGTAMRVAPAATSEQPSVVPGMAERKKYETEITDVALDAPPEPFGFAAEQLFPPKDEPIGPVPEGAPRLSPREGDRGAAR